jgi:hypothetical protein
MEPEDDAAWIALAAEVEAQEEEDAAEAAEQAAAMAGAAGSSRIRKRTREFLADNQQVNSPFLPFASNSDT